MRPLSWRAGLGALWLASASAQAFAPPSPVTVSPGALDAPATVADRCPTFSWGAVPRARSYDLAVFDLGPGAAGADHGPSSTGDEDDDVGQADPIVRVALPGSATSWTPSLERCLDAGGTYAWFLRALGSAGASGWSRARLLRIEEVQPAPRIPGPGTLDRAGAAPRPEPHGLAAANTSGGDRRAHDPARQFPPARIGAGAAVAERPSFGVSRGNGGFLIAEFKNSNPLPDDQGSALIDLVNGDKITARWRLGVGGRNNALGLDHGELYLERYGAGPHLWIAGNGTTVMPQRLWIGPVRPTANPLTPVFDNRLHVTGSVSGVATPDNHVALISNSSGDGSADVLALRTGELGEIGADDNFVTFFNGLNESQGAIQGNGAAGVALAGPGADYAEWLEKVDPGEQLAPGQVVGLRGGRVGLRTAGAERVMVVSTAPIVVGNDPGEDERHRYARVAFVGQAEVAISGSAQAGDLLVDSGRNDGRAIALSPAEVSLGELPRVLGRALEAAPHGAASDPRVRTLVGLPDSALLAVLLAERDRRLGDLTERVAALERLTGVPTAAASQEPTP